MNWHKKEEFWYIYPVVAETYDGFLNDTTAFTSKKAMLMRLYILPKRVFYWKAM